MSAQVTQKNVLARLGGDEFGLLLSNCNLNRAQQITQALHDVITSYVFSWEQRQFNVGVSIGMASLNGNIVSIKELFIHADAACYRAKNQGSNRICVHQIEEDVIRYHQQEIDCVTRIQQALLKNHFKLWGQTIAIVADERDTLQANAKIHVEVLLRLQTENEGLLRPVDFLPTAERYNLASRIDRWVIQNVISWFTEHKGLLDQLGLLAINLSGQSLTDTDLFPFIQHILGRTAFPAHKLCFEITETAAIASLHEASELIMALKKHGCLFALDDFGSGLSSFAYLKSLPVDFLKIDGQFVKDCVSDPIDFAMVKSINEIGHVLGKKTIAEYVENGEILEKLKGIGVDYAQGYFSGHPQPLQQFFRLRI